MTEAGEKVALAIQQLGPVVGQSYDNVQDVKGAVQAKDYEESAKELRKPAKPIYPPWPIRKPDILI